MIGTEYEQRKCYFVLNYDTVIETKYGRAGPREDLYLHSFSELEAGNSQRKQFIPFKI